MSVVMRMEMPKCCDDCAANYDCMACGITGTRWYGSEEFDPSNGRLPDCPIICQLPEEHGRLIDWDAFERIGFKLCRKTNEWKAELGTPTNESYVVPAERSET